MTRLIASLTSGAVLSGDLTRGSTGVTPLADTNLTPTRLKELIVLLTLLQLEGRGSVLLAAAEAVLACLFPDEAGADVGSDTGLTTPLSTNIIACAIR